MARRLSAYWLPALICAVAPFGYALAQEPSSPAEAQAAPTSETQAAGESAEAPLYLKFVSSYSGGAITSAQLEVDGAPPQDVVAHGSLMMLMLPEGRHKINVAADGYTPMELDVNVTAGETPVMEIELDPLQAAEPEQVADDMAVVRGTVLDADTAEPVAGARLSLAESALATRTTATGEFRFEVRTGPASDERRPAITLEASAEEYQAIRLANIPLVPGSEARIPVKLSRPTSATEQMDVVEIDHWTSPGSDFSTEWTFDVTIR